MHVFSNLSCFWFGKMKLIGTFYTASMGPRVWDHPWEQRTYISTFTWYINISTYMNSWFYSSKLGKFICKYTISIHFHGSVHAINFIQLKSSCPLQPVNHINIQTWTNEELRYCIYSASFNVVYHNTHMSFKIGFYLLANPTQVFKCRHDFEFMKIFDKQKHPQDLRCQSPTGTHCSLLRRFCFFFRFWFSQKIW